VSVSFDTYLPLLTEKWREVPPGSDAGGRLMSDQLIDQERSALLSYWDRQAAEGEELRGWYWRLYTELFRGKKVLEIGSGLGFDAIHFASHGAIWTCCDLVSSNLAVIGRVAEARGLKVEFLLIESIRSFAGLPVDYDFVWCNGSVHHAPFEAAREECGAIIPHLKKGGRWIELSYPRERWAREGSPPFGQWGKMTDGERTPWVEWYDLEKLKRRLAPHQVVNVLDLKFSSDSFIWLDVLVTGQLLDVDAKREEIAPPAAPITTPPHLWNFAWSTPLVGFSDVRNLTVEVNCVVETGTVGFGIERNGQFISREVMAEARSGSQILYLSTTDFGADVSLSARNTSALGPSRFKVLSIVLRHSL
jgi:SAM-dependent methyltransferase